MTILEQPPTLELDDDVHEPSAAAAPAATLASAELAECTCPDFCERDHGNE